MNIIVSIDREFCVIAVAYDQATAWSSLHSGPKSQKAFIRLVKEYLKDYGTFLLKEHRAKCSERNLAFAEKVVGRYYNK